MAYNDECEAARQNLKTTLESGDATMDDVRAARKAFIETLTKHDGHLQVLWTNYYANDIQGIFEFPDDDDSTLDVFRDLFIGGAFAMANAMAVIHQDTPDDHVKFLESVTREFEAYTKAKDFANQPPAGTA